MKKGFRIEIQKNLSKRELTVAIKKANDFIKNAIEHDLSWKHETQGGWHSFYKRGIVGLRLEEGLIFRRASKSRRIFQIVRGDLLKIVSDRKYFEIPEKFDQTQLEEIPKKVSDGCMCPRHTGGLKVSNIYGDIETETYCEIGEIKG